MKDFFENMSYDDISEFSEFIALGEADHTDDPVWSGFSMHEFFNNNPIKIEDFTTDLRCKLGLYIELSTEESIPSYIYDYLNHKIVIEERAIAAKSGILETFLKYQFEAEENAIGVVRDLEGVFESRADSWECFFGYLFEFAAHQSFREVNGYQIPDECRNGYDRSVDDVKTGGGEEMLELCDCQWPGVYAFKCNASGYIKIGMSNKNVHSRVKGQLSSLPCGGEFLHAFKCKNATKAEGEAHYYFGSSRVNPRKEWFETSPDRVVSYLKGLVE